MTVSNAPDPVDAPRLADLLPSAQAAASRFAVAGLLPIVTFYALYRMAGPSVGILGGMTVSLTVLAIQAYRLKRLDPIVLVPMLLILIQGSVAVVLGSVELYLLVPAFENVLWGAALAGSVALRRPLVRMVANELRLIPARYAGSASLDRALGQITLVWAVVALIKAAMRVWLLQMLPLELFLAAVTMFNSVLNGLTMGFSFWWGLRAARATDRLPRQ